MVTLIDPRRKTGWVKLAVRMLLAATFSLCLLAVASYYYLSEPMRLAFLTGQLLEQLTGARAQIERARVSFSGEIDLEGIHLRVPGIDGPGGELFTAERTILRIDPLAALRGKVVAREMVFIRPVLWLTQIEDGEFNYERLRVIKMEKSTEPMRLPGVIIRQGQLRYGDVHHGKYEFYPLDVLGELTPDTSAPSRYYFQLHQYVDRGPNSIEDPAKATAGPTMRGSFDLDRLEVTAKLSDFALIDPHRATLPRQIRQRWEMFEPSGTLPNAKLEYDPKTGIRVEVKLEGVAITIPQLSTPEYRMRMTDVSGTFRFDSDRVSITNLVGQIEGIQYRINGEILGYSADAPFSFAMDTRAFRIPETPRYMPAMPLPVQQIFHMLRPVGWMRVSLATSRAKPGGPIDYRGTSNIISGADVLAEIRRFPKNSKYAELLNLPADAPEFISHGSYFKFPYPLSNVHGMITFNPQVIEVHNLTGDTPGGGSATITGIIGPPSPDPAIDLNVTAVNIPFDDVLKKAMGPRQQLAMGLFFDHEKLAALRAKGVITTRARHEELLASLDQLNMELADNATPAARRAAIPGEIAALKKQLAVPVFELGGRGNAQVKVKQAAGPKQPIDLEVALDIKSADVLFKYFPCPISVQSGRLMIAKEEVVFDAIRARGLSGAVAGMQGSVHVPDPGHTGEITPDIVLVAQNVPVDELLLSTIPAPQDRWLRTLNLTGTFNADGRIFRAPHGYDIDFTLGPSNPVTATPGGGQFTLSDIDAQLKLTLRDLKILRLTGKHGQATIEGTGSADWSASDTPTVHLDARATGLRFEDPVIDLLAPAVPNPDEIRAFWAERQPRGRFDASLNYSKPVTGEPTFTLAVAPESLSFLNRKARISLEKTTGRIAIDHSRILLEKFTGRFDGGTLSVDGPIVFEPHVRAELAVVLDGDSIGPSLRKGMPPTMAELLTRVNFSGHYHAEIPKLVVVPGATTGDWITADATVDIAGASAIIGLPVTEFDGRIAVNTRVDAASQQADYAIGVTAKQLRVLGRKISDVSLQAASAQKGDAIVVPVLRGKTYGGTIDGKVAVSILDGGYNVQMAVADVDLKQLMADTTSTTPNPRKTGEPTLRGLMNAAVSLEGSWREGKIKRGRGDLLVHDAQLEGVPLAMGLLHVAHLTLPGSNRFNRGAVSYYVQDDKVVLEHIQLDSPDMRFAGNGTMQYSSGAVDITLTTSNPAGLKLGPLTELIDKARNQLVTLRILGTVEKPDVKVRQFNGITEAWRDVFGGDKHQ